MYAVSKSGDLMNDSFYTIIGLATIALILFGLVKGFLYIKGKSGLMVAILVAVLLLVLAITISVLTTVYLS